jgi:hypothetical protein
MPGRTAEYSAAELRAAGFEARIEAIPGLVSFPREAELTILSPQHKAIPANSFGQSISILLYESAGNDEAFSKSYPRFGRFIEFTTNVVNPDLPPAALIGMHANVCFVDPVSLLL